MKLLLELPVLPHVKKYLDVRYPDLYRLSENDHVGEYLMGLLRAQKEYSRMDDYMHRYTKTFLVETKEWRSYERSRMKVSSLTVVRFNSFIEGQIRQEMYGLLDLCKRFKVQKRAVAIREFMQAYNFSEDDIAYDTLLKSYQRYSARKEKSKIALKSSDEFVHKKSLVFS